jgi:hypothetical protein
VRDIMLSYFGSIFVELSEIVKIEISPIRPKSENTAFFTRTLYITTPDGVYTLRLRTDKENKPEALKVKQIK